jgi:hypothetical protein
MTDAATLKAELVSLIEDYLGGYIKLHAFILWEHKQMHEIEASGDDELRRVSGAVIAVPCLIEDGAITEDEFRDELRQELHLLRTAA